MIPALWRSALVVMLFTTGPAFAQNAGYVDILIDTAQPLERREKAASILMSMPGVAFQRVLQEADALYVRSEAMTEAIVATEYPLGTIARANVISAMAQWFTLGEMLRGEPGSPAAIIMSDPEVIRSRLQAPLITFIMHGMDDRSTTLSQIVFTETGELKGEHQQALARECVDALSKVLSTTQDREVYQAAFLSASLLVVREFEDGRARRWGKRGELLTLHRMAVDAPSPALRASALNLIVALSSYLGRHYPGDQIENRIIKWDLGERTVEIERSVIYQALDTFWDQAIDSMKSELLRRSVGSNGHQAFFAAMQVLRWMATNHDYFHDRAKLMTAQNAKFALATLFGDDGFRMKFYHREGTVAYEQAMLRVIRMEASHRDNPDFSAATETIRFLVAKGRLAEMVHAQDPNLAREARWTVFTVAAVESDMGPELRREIMQKMVEVPEFTSRDERMRFIRLHLDRLESYSAVRLEEADPFAREQREMIAKTCLQLSLTLIEAASQETIDPDKAIIRKGIVEVMGKHGYEVVLKIAKTSDHPTRAEAMREFATAEETVVRGQKATTRAAVELRFPESSYAAHRYASSRDPRLTKMALGGRYMVKTELTMLHSSRGSR